jgi:hypothetical protein
LARRLLLGLNMALVLVLGAFAAWDWHAEHKALLRQGKTSLDEEAKILLAVVRHTRQDGADRVQAVIDEACGAMREISSPGHHIAVRMGGLALQARSHGRASTAMRHKTCKLQNSREWARGTGWTAWTGLRGGRGCAAARPSPWRPVHPVHLVHVSEYPSNMRTILRRQIVRRVGSVVAAGVAGDYYDLLPLQDGGLLVCVADVTGHDVPAAMVASMLKALVLNAVERSGDPRQILQMVNRVFWRVTLEEDFAGMFLARWDPAAHTLTCAGAGNEPTVLTLDLS